VWAFVYDHDLSKKTDVYVAANFSKFDSNGVAQQTCASTSATATNQPAACSAAAQNAGANVNGQNGTLSQWGNLAGMSISYFGVGLRMKF
jgi:predicted porin